MRFITVCLLMVGSVLWLGAETYAQEKPRKMTGGEREAHIKINVVSQYIDMGEFGKAKEILDELIQKNPDYKMARDYRYLVLMLTDQPKLALEDAKYLNPQGHHANVYRMLGGKKVELAKRREFQKLAPNDVKNNAFICELEGRIEEAERLWNSLVHSEKGEYYLSQRASFYIRHEMYPKALEDIKNDYKRDKESKVFNDSIDYIFLQRSSRIYHKMGKTDLAFASYIELIKRYLRCPEHIDGMEMDLVFLDTWILTRLPEMKEEAKQFEHLWLNWLRDLDRVEWNEDTAYTRLLVAVYAGKKKPEVMETRIKEVAKRAPYGATIMRGAYYLGMFYKINGEPDKAKALFQKVIDAGPKESLNN